MRLLDSWWKGRSIMLKAGGGTVGLVGLCVILSAPSSFAQAGGPWTVAGGNVSLAPSTSHIGVGVTAPKAKVHIRPTEANPTEPGLIIDATMASLGAAASTARLRLGSDTSGAELYYVSSAPSNRLLITADVTNTTNGYPLIIMANGTVGIGAMPSGTAYKLSVNGSLRAKEVVVETNWPDFVFDSGYKLQSLPEVESYIQKHKHLPDIPSAPKSKATASHSARWRLSVSRKWKISR
jgi:hypothetical protein